MSATIMHRDVPDQDVPQPLHPINWIFFSEIASCRRCPRLVRYRERIAREKRRAYREWTYWGRPVPGFGDPHARVVIIGLAPGAHGANRTGRIFTGDSSGDFLYAALHRAGFANQPTSKHAYDGLQLRDVFITAICRCVPPDNQPTPREIANCRPFLARELALLTQARVVITLGRIACDGYLRLLREQGHVVPRVEFAHGAVYVLGAALPTLICSYHPSRQNTQTGRLTAEMFDKIFQKAKCIMRNAGNDLRFGRPLLDSGIPCRTRWRHRMPPSRKSGCQVAEMKINARNA